MKKTLNIWCVCYVTYSTYTAYGHAPTHETEESIHIYKQFNVILKPTLLLVLFPIYITYLNSGLVDAGKLN